MTMSHVVGLRSPLTALSKSLSKNNYHIRRSQINLGVNSNGGYHVLGAGAFGEVCLPLLLT